MSAELVLFFSELIKRVIILLIVLILFWLKKRLFSHVKKS